VGAGPAPLPPFLCSAPREPARGPGGLRRRSPPAEGGPAGGTAAGPHGRNGRGQGRAWEGAEGGGACARRPVVAQAGARGGAGVPRRRRVELAARRAGEGQWPQAALGLAAARAGMHRSGPAACARWRRHCHGGAAALRRRGAADSPGKTVGEDE